MTRTLAALLCGAALFACASGITRAEETPADKSMADRYLEAARGGDATAQYYLGALHSAGVGRSQSDTEAFQWFSRAAEQGHAQAILILSGLYVVGRGTTKDNISAYKWAAIAASGARIEETRTGARQLMGLLETKMTQEELRQAKTEAERWRPAPSRSRNSSDDRTRDRTTPEPLPPLSSQPRPSTSDDSSRSGRLQESERAPAPSDKKDSAVDDLLSRVPPGLRKRLGL